MLFVAAWALPSSEEGLLHISINALAWLRKDHDQLDRWEIIWWSLFPLIISKNVFSTPAINSVTSPSERVAL